MNKRYYRQQFGTHTIFLYIVVTALIVGWIIIAIGESKKDHVEKANSLPTTSNTDPVKLTPTAIQAAVYSQNQIPIIHDNSLVPALNPRTFHGKKPEPRYQTYIVQRGDTPNGIAKQFNINPETLLGGNPRLSQESSLLQTGMELIILPIDGVLHDIELGDTLDSIAILYSIPVEDIIAYKSNNLEFPYRVYQGTQIMVPEAIRKIFSWTPPTLSSITNDTSFQGQGVKPIIVGTGTFLFPINSQNFTQRYWYGHQAVDIALPEGSAVYASDTGTVTYAGWDFWGYGNLVVINHGNGYETFYAHLNNIGVSPGQIIYQGAIVGSTGNTGNSSGPHIHFEIRLNGKPDDPCWYLGC